MALRLLGKVFGSKLPKYEFLYFRSLEAVIANLNSFCHDDENLHVSWIREYVEDVKKYYDIYILKIAHGQRFGKPA